MFLLHFPVETLNWTFFPQQKSIFLSGAHFLPYSSSSLLIILSLLQSALEWTLKLNGVQTVLDLKTWYDQVYLARFQRLKEQMINDK